MTRLCPIFVIMALVLSACSLPTLPGMAETTSAPTSTPTWAAAVSKPLSFSWKMPQNVVAAAGEFRFGVHGALVTSNQVTLLYILTGPTAATPLTSSLLEVKDDAKRVLSAAPKVVPLAQLPGLQYGAIIVAPRPRGVHELRLLIHPSPQASALDLVAVEQVASPDMDDPAITGWATRDGYVEQGGYRISFNSSGLKKGDRVANATLTPGRTMAELKSQDATAAASRPTPKPGVTSTIPRTPAAEPITLQLSGGKPILSDETFRIEAIQSRQVQYLYVVFLMDGDVKGTIVP